MKQDDDGSPAKGDQPRTARAEYTRRLLIIGLFIVLLIMAWQLLDLLLLIFGAVLLAVLLRAIADPLASSTRLPQNWSLVLAVIGVLAFVLVAGWLFGAEIRSQMEGLSTRLAQAWRPYQVRLQATEAGRELLRWIQTAIFGPDRMGYVARVAAMLANGLADSSW